MAENKKNKREEKRRTKEKDRKKTEGLIGYVPQDDLLMENLTVSQNLFYNSKLVFGDWSDEKIQAKAEQLLQSMGLYEAKDLKVGDALANIISGGQRKRLNIALELIREPGVLFVDEPTSGLSSRDSENVMDLLKQLSISGKLVFVVIHQPSSDIFKMFDKLLILDIGGYPIYFGNPSDRHSDRHDGAPTTVGSFRFARLEEQLAAPEGEWQGHGSSREPAELPEGIRR